MLAVQPVNLDRATAIVLKAEIPIWQHNIRGSNRFRLTCTATAPVRLMRCSLRIRRNAKLLYVFRSHVRVVPTEPQDVYYRFEDGSARIRYSANRALVVRPDR